MVNIFFITMFTCAKIYNDIPFAHRQHTHEGHCALIHGHNWSIKITFKATKLDENGFVIDFGKLKFIRQWIEEHLDHACLFNEDDPLLDTILSTAPNAYKPYIIRRCSCEGLAEHLFDIFTPMVEETTENRVHIARIDVKEDSRNSGAFTANT